MVKKYQLNKGFQICGENEIAKKNVLGWTFFVLENVGEKRFSHVL